MFRLPSALVRHVGGFLCWLDCMALRNTNRYTAECFDPSFRMTGNAGFRAILVKHLNTLGIDGERFCLLLKENNCILSGSLILQCMLGVSWKRMATPRATVVRAAMKSGTNTVGWKYRMRDFRYVTVTKPDISTVVLKRPMISDIDVFQLRKNCEEVGVMLASAMSTPFQCHGDSPESKQKITHVCTFADCYPYCNNFVRDICGIQSIGKLATGIKNFPANMCQGRIFSEMWVHGDSQLTVVSLNHDQLESKSLVPLSQIANYIGRYFDFSFLKNMFDGTRLYVRDMDSIMSRRCGVNVLGEKYRNRNPNGPENPIHCPDEVIRNRATKYEKRGFAITLNPTRPVDDLGLRRNADKVEPSRCA